MPIINYDDYYKPNKPQPKAPTKYYQPPKPKAATPPKRINTTSPGSGKPNVLVNDGGGQGAWWNAPNETAQQAPIPEYLQGISNWNQTYYSNNPSPFPKIFPDFGKSISQTMAEQYPPIPPRQSYYDIPVYENGRTYWKRVQNVYDSNTRRGGAAPTTTASMPFVATPWASQTISPTYSTAGNNYGQRSSPTFVPTTRMSDDRAWQNSRARTGDAIRPQDYFMRTVLNGIGYSIPNQMLNFTDTGGVSADWAQTPRWYEPPAGYTTSGAGWKESIGKPWGLQDVTDHGTYELIGKQGGGYGWGGGWGGGGSASYGASSGVNSYLPGTHAGYGANASSPRYTGGAGGRGSSYAGAQSMNQASWRMPMLVWNI